MAQRGRAKWTARELGQLVDAYLEECSAAGLPPTRQGFCRKIGVSLSTLDRWDADEAYIEHSEQVARIGLACGHFWEKKPLEDPKLANFAMFMLRQPCYGGYRDRPEQSISVTIAARGARINWGR